MSCGVTSGKLGDRYESQRLAEIRERVCYLYGWTSPYVTAETVRARYQELWDIKQSKEQP